MSNIFKPRFFSVHDFKEWKVREELDLAPNFQRRGVWPIKAKSYLIDSILRGLPMPSIYMREKMDRGTKKVKREIVDGQQRLTAILSFLNDGFVVLPVHNKEFGNIPFSKLPDEVQSSFLNYEISTTIILDDSDSTVLDMFARLNTYTVTLVKIEKLNAEYFGAFKQLAFLLGREFNQFWLSNKVLTEKNIFRMADAELSAELLIAMMEGIRPNNEQILRTYFKKFDDKFPDSDKFTTKFKYIIDSIGGIFSDSLQDSRFSDKTLFYNLFCALYDFHYGLPDSKVERIRIVPASYPKIREALSYIEEILEEPEEYQRFSKFISSMNGHTNNLNTRLLRHKFICDRISEKVR